MPDDFDRLALRAHQDWLGFLQPEGLVVAPAALVEAQAFVDSSDAAPHAVFRGLVQDFASVGHPEPVPAVLHFADLARDVLGWPDSAIVRTDLPETYLPNEGETLRPTFAVRDGDAWLLLGQEHAEPIDFDAVPEAAGHGWEASPQAKFERLLREVNVPIGLLFNRAALRLVYAPRGESTGHLTFPVGVLSGVEGRPAFAALRMLLRTERLFTLSDGQRLPDLLARSRRYQNTVSTELARQVLAALFDLLRGFQVANDRTRGELLRDVLARDPDQVYAGLLTVLMRLVFLLYAEDRGLMSADPVYLNHYAVTGLFDELREDAARFPDTMDQRYGAWARLTALFRLVHDGGAHGPFKLPARKGHLFDPAAYPFLDSVPGDAAGIPMVPDGTVFRVLRNLLVLDGERLSYRSLDVEQIGSVYEAVMGFRLETATGPSVALKPAKTHGAPVTINLDELRAESGDKRAKWLKERADTALTGQALTALKAAKTNDDLAAALERRIATDLTPAPVTVGAMVLQPSDERRRSGSHYTPRTLTEPIVRKALAPVLSNLTGSGASPTPDQILALKVCDPAMGSGAFLVEACRQLGDALVAAWHAHGVKPRLPAFEDEVLYARRLVAQRCLYGVDKNPMAVGLAKLSLWLATLAKDHPFTFLDHALKHGDSLVGLTRAQIERFHWKADKVQGTLAQQHLVERIEAATAARNQLLELGDSDDHDLKRQKLALADEQLNVPRRLGDLVIAAFFAGENDKKREEKRKELLALQPVAHEAEPYRELKKALDKLHLGEHGLRPFHWEIEFPEVFGQAKNGFDLIVGNPPFLGGTRISTEYGMAYFAWLIECYSPAGHLCDLVAYFFRRTFDLLRPEGLLGLIATNSVAQGDTREGGLKEILKNGGTIRSAVRRLRWPGMAAVVVCVVHIQRSKTHDPGELDGEQVPRISAYLFPGHVDDSPAKLPASPYFSIGSKIYGQGFVFDDADEKASPVSTMDAIIRAQPEAATRIFPYIGGEELNTSPAQQHHRHVIYLSDIESEDGLDRFPGMAEIVRTKVKPERDVLGSNPNNIPLKRRWWAYQAHRPELYSRLKRHSRVLANSQVGNHLTFAFLPTGWIYSHALSLFELSTDSAFAVMQSRIHEVWARFLGSSMKDDLRYTPSDCFETFPFPEGFETNPALEAAGQAYYEYRAALMVDTDLGLTKTYNRFHDPSETDPRIAELRRLHAAMDRTVLDAYGWTDLHPTCEFLLDYEDEEEDEPKSKRKKPWRYRWPDEFRDEVLARLLELNKVRSAAEQAVKKPAAKKKAGGRKKKGTNAEGDQGTALY